VDKRIEVNPAFKTKIMSINNLQPLLQALQADIAECYEICPPAYSNFLNGPGLYAIRYGGEILYLGKATRSVRKRFQGGHHALVRILMNGIPGSELKLAIAPITGQSVKDLAQIEAQLLQLLRPPYNVQYPSIEE
jgi:hypothetical protein